MKRSLRWFMVEGLILGVGGGVGWTAGCAGANSVEVVVADGGVVTGNPLSSPGDGGGGTAAMSVASCTQCLSSSDCGGGVCAQVQGDSFCAPSCVAAGALCPAGTTCAVETAYNGAQVSVCIPDNACAGGVIAPAGGGGGGGGGGGTVPVCTPTASNCDGYAPPTTPSTCDSCSATSSSCQANGCYGGWYCDVTTSKCHAPPSGCSGSGGTTCTPSAGGGKSGGTGSSGGSGGGGGTTGTTPIAVTGTVGASGGSVSSLLFAIVGDTRPANEDDTGGYPSTIIDTIFSGIAARSPQPSFVVATGDYQYANPTGGQSAPQIAMYMAARAKFPGPFFPTMGNHECTGYTASNCGSGNTDGVTSNLTNFLSSMLAPLNQTKPYYSIKVNAADGSWTSKFVFVAANAWDSTESSWLESTLAETTTYTFVIRHEANEANTAPGVSPSESIITQHPVTLEICGHTHDVSKSGNRIVMGNGGAPLTGSGDYGYGLVAQLSNGNLTVDEFNYQTGAADPSFHFVVNPAGSVQ